MKAIRLLRLGTAREDIVESLQEPLEQIFRVPIVLAQSHPDIEEFYDPPRGQYNSTSILLHLKSIEAHLRTAGWRNRGRTKTLAVLDSDLFIPILTYVFGEAELNGDVAVVSYYRLMNELYGLPGNDAVFMQRVRKEALHELGHLYGLFHCEHQECAMHASTYVEDIDLKGDSFCNRCLDVVRRS